MADYGRKRLVGRRISSTSASIEMGKSTKERKSKKPKERWLLTRKTWRYMTDAGRKLIPDGALNRPEDVPKIEAYFQEVCQREPRFLLWRKSSYPGALGFRSHRSRRNRKGGSCRTKSNSADECDELGRKPSQLFTAQHISGGRFDIQKMKLDFLKNTPKLSQTQPTSTGPSTSSSSQQYGPGGPRGALKRLDLPATHEEDNDETQLAQMLGDFLKIQDTNNTSGKVDDKGGTFDYHTLVDKLQQHLNSIYNSQSYVPTHSSHSPSRYATNVEFEGDYMQKSLSETLNRYFSRSPNRQQVISDILTDRKMLEKLYSDLRQTKGYRNTRGGTSSTNFNSNLGSRFVRPTLRHYNTREINNDGDEEYDSYEDNNDLGSWKRLGKSQFKSSAMSPPMSPPPLISIQQESTEIVSVNCGIQTDPLSDRLLKELERDYQNKLKSAGSETEEGLKSPVKSNVPRRKSSVDHDDVSQSVSDTIKRYLRMARKKSVDADKVDRFKRVNYDKNLRFIKAKGEITKPGDDDGLNKGSQTNDEWITIYKNLVFDTVPISDSTSPISGDDYVFGVDVGSRMTSSRSSFETTVGDDNTLLNAYTQPAGVTSPQVSPKSSPSSPPSPSGLIASGQSFLSHLLHGNKQHNIEKNHSPINTHPVTAGAAVAMQKSKSSSSVGSRLVGKKIWRSRSKSQTRATTGATCTWTPQGQCTWTNVTGRQVTLQDTTLLQLTEVERRVLQKVALAKLQALNLGVTVRIPSDSSAVPVTKPKRRAYLLKRKALTTSFFDNTRTEKDKGGADLSGQSGGSTGAGLVFGIPLNQCIENDRLARVARGGSPLRNSRSELSGSGDPPSSSSQHQPSSTVDINLRRQSHHGSRASFSSLIDTTTARTEDNGSCESLMSRERIGTSVPGLLDTLSSSASDLAVTSSEEDPGIPQMVTACLRYLEAHGLHTLGIFRVSSSKKRVRQLREDFDSGKEILIGEDQCPHDVATLLKEYLRDLPDPLLCRDLYHPFVQSQKVRNRRLQFEALQHLVQLLPAPNRDTLWALLNFLACVAFNANDQTESTGEWIAGNKMDSTNLATVFAPNILHCIKTNSSTKESNERADERMDVINVIRSMIDHNRQLFYVSAELLDEVYTIMMETNPEALDQLLSKKDQIMIGDEAIDDLLDSETSTPKTPTAPVSLDGNQMIQGDSEEYQTAANRKVYTREQFLHGTAGMGGPNLAMRVRHKDRERGRDKFTKRRWRDDSASRRQIGAEESSMYELMKSRSSSMDSGNVQIDSPTDNSRILRITEEQRYSSVLDSRRQSTPLLDNANIITASLKIPLQPSSSGPLSLNLDDPDIPYIEDNTYTITTDGRQQMPIGILRNAPTAPPRRRQRSISGSDSSQGSIQPVSGSISIMQQQAGYDSAMGSSATFSSPPRNTPSSVGSSIAGDGMYSSPPSWASTPPTSPDSSRTTVNYIPDDSQQAIYSRMMVPKQQIITTKTTETSSSLSSAILQKVTFTSASELRQKPKHVELQTYKKETSTSSFSTEVSKSASTPVVIQKEMRVSEQKFSPSISNIGGAVLRSKTADFERMTNTKKSEGTTTTKSKSESTPVSSTTSDKKKYVKRRYTDSRHQTRHIPDAETLAAATTTTSKKSDTEKSTLSKDQQQSQVYKRRELIASVPKEKRSLF